MLQNEGEVAEPNDLPGCFLLLATFGLSVYSRLVGLQTENLARVFRQRAPVLDQIAVAVDILDDNI